MLPIKSAFSIDNYYDSSFYNEVKASLTNNGVDFYEMISTKTPNHWFFIANQYPIAIDYDKISTSLIPYLVTKVKPLSFNDEYKLFRKGGGTGKSKGGDIAQFIENAPLKRARNSSYSCFFHVKSLTHLRQISKMFPDKIHFFGKYHNNKYKVCLATHEAIKGVIDLDTILVESNSKGGEIGHLETELNYKVFNGKDYLMKFTDTPYMEDGKYSKVNIQGDREGKSKYILT